MAPDTLRNKWLGAHLDGVLGPGMDEVNFHSAIDQKHVEAAKAGRIVHFAHESAISFRLHPAAIGELLRALELDGLTGVKERILFAVESQTLAKGTFDPGRCAFASPGCLAKLTC